MTDSSVLLLWKEKGLQKRWKAANFRSGNWASFHIAAVLPSASKPSSESTGAENPVLPLNPDKGPLLPRACSSPPPTAPHPAGYAVSTAKETCPARSPHPTYQTRLPAPQDSLSPRLHTHSQAGCRHLFWIHPPEGGCAISVASLDLNGGQGMAVCRSKSGTRHADQRIHPGCGWDSSQGQKELAAGREAGKCTNQRQLSKGLYISAGVQRVQELTLPGRDQGLFVNIGGQNIFPSLVACDIPHTIYVPSSIPLSWAPQEVAVGLKNPPELRSPCAILSCHMKSTSP